MGSFDRSLVWLQPQDLPKHDLEEHLKRVTRPNRSSKTVILYPSLQFSKRLKDITNRGSLKSYLRANQIWIKNEEFGARPVTTAGFLTHVHPRLTRFEHCVQSMKFTMTTAEARNVDKDLWLSRHPEINSKTLNEMNPVPHFTLFSSKQSTPHGGVRISTDVANIRYSTDDCA